MLADTKFEFGMLDGEIVLGDEVLTPDSSRYWPLELYQPGRPQVSYDKQYVPRLPGIGRLGQDAARARAAAGSRRQHVGEVPGGLLHDHGPGSVVSVHGPAVAPDIWPVTSVPGSVPCSRTPLPCPIRSREHQ